MIRPKASILTIASFTSWNRIWRKIVSVNMHPTWLATAQHFVFAVWVLGATIGHIGNATLQQRRRADTR